VKAAVGKLIAEMKQAGVLQAAEVLAPSSRCRRVQRSGARTAVLDGPFAESKELLSGFVALKLDSMDEAVAWAERYVQVLGETQLDVRPLLELAEL